MLGLRTAREPAVTWRETMVGDLDAKDLILALDARVEVQRAAVAGPLQVGRNEIERRERRGRHASAHRRDHDLRWRFLGGGRHVRDRLSVGRPARRVVGTFGRGDLRQRAAAVGADRPDIGIAAAVVLVSSSIRDERDARAVRRPLRIGVVPVVAVRDLMRAAGGEVHDPDVRSLVVVPAGVVELVRQVRVVANVAQRGRRPLVARTGAAQARGAVSRRRRHAVGDAVHDARHLARRPAGERQNPQLRPVRSRAPGRAAGARVGRRARRDEFDRRIVGEPSRTARRPRFVDQHAGGRASIGRRDPHGGDSPILRAVHARDDVHDARAVGRDVRIGDELEREVVLRRDTAGLRGNGQRRDGEKSDDD